MKAKIPVKAHADNPSLSWEERYKCLESHHYEEVEALTRVIELLEASQCIDCRVDAWHASDSEQLLHEWLGMTSEDYKQWLEKK